MWKSPKCAIDTIKFSIHNTHWCWLLSCWSDSSSPKNENVSRWIWSQIQITNEFKGVGTYIVLTVYTAYITTCVYDLIWTFIFWFEFAFYSQVQIQYLIQIWNTIALLGNNNKDNNWIGQLHIYLIWERIVSSIMNTNCEGVLYTSLRT